MARRVSFELIAALVVVAAGVSGGTYFYLQGESPVNLVRAVRDMPAGVAITADCVELTPTKRRDIPEWFKSERDAKELSTKQGCSGSSFYLEKITDAMGEKSADPIKKDQFIYKRAGGCCNYGCAIYGTYLISHKAQVYSK